MTEVGNMVIGESAELLRIDGGFQDIMRAPAAALLGRSVLDFTCPADRPVFLRAMTELRSSGRPFQVNKRLLRPDGSTVWVSKTVSIADFGTGDTAILGVVATIDPPAAAADPAAMMAEARRQADQTALRAAAFGSPLFAQPQWAMLLMAYIWAAEGGMPLAGLARAAGALPSQSLRWVRALVAEGLLEEDRMGAVPLYAISASGRDLLESYLAAAITA